MSYMLLIVEQPGDRQQRSLEEGQQVYDRMMRFGADLKSRGLLVAAESLKSHGQASRFSKQNGKPALVDGPFSEAKEMIGGFFLLSCNSRDEALSIAAQCPAAEWATVEIRELGPCYGD